MVNVECPGCSAPYNVSEKRIPATGLKMRCPKCGESFVVNKPGGDSPGAAPPRPQAPPPRPPPRQPTAGASVGAPTPPPQSKSVFQREAPAAPRRGAPTAMAGSLNIPVLDQIGAGPMDDGFGVLDMSLPGDGGGFDDGTDLPMPAEAADLPMPAARADLPVPARRGGRGHDLPLAASAAGLPMVADSADLPVPAHHGDLPMPAHYHDLPAPAAHADLPVPAGYGDLPMPSAHDDLPMPAAYADLPAPTDGDLPIPAAHGDLPLPHLHGDLPVPNDQDLPLPFAGGDLPLPVDQDFPLPAAHGDLPLPADFNLPASAEGDLPMALDDDFPAPRGGHDAFRDGGGFPGELGSEPPPGMPAAPPPRREGGGVGDEFALDVDESGLATEVDDGLGRGPRVALKKKSRKKSLRIAIAAISILGVGGGLLTFTSMGPYGAYAISDALNADAHQAAFTSFREAARGELDQDTAAETVALVERAKNELAQMPRFAPMSGYTAYLALVSNLRFGRDAAVLAAGRQLLTDDKPSGDMGILAQAALVALDGNVPQAQSMLSGLGDRLADDIDVQVLAGEVALLGDAPKEAVAAWTKATATHKSARTHYGLARAQVRAGDSAAALASLDEVLGLSKNHAGARILKATVLYDADKTSEEAQKLLTEVTSDGPVKSAASTAERVEALSLSGTMQLSRGAMTDAEASFKAALDLDPKSERALIGNGELLYVAGRYSEAIARYKVAREVNAASIPATVGIAKSLLKLERANDAQTELATAAKTSKHPLIGYWLGQTQEALGDRKAAEATYRDAIKGAPSHPDAVMVYVALSSLLGSRGEQEEANQVLAEATEKLKESAALHNAKGDVALEGGRIPEAKAAFLKALELEPNNSMSRFRLAVAHRRARDIAAAQVELDKLKKADPSFPGLMLEQGLLLQLAGKVDEALAIYTEALKKAPDDVDLKLRVAATQVVSGYPKKALPLLLDVHGKRPRSAEVNHYLGRAQFLSGENPQQALANLKLASTLDANRPEYHLWVAIVANAIRDFPTAESAVDAALAIDKNYGDAFWQKGVTVLERGRTKDAIDLLHIALQKNPTLFEAHASLGRCYEDQLDQQSAERSWRKALEGDDNNAEWHFRLAKLMVSRNARDEALPHLKKAVTLVKDDLKPAWLWNAHYLLAETVRQSEPKTALASYKEFVKLTNTENAYRAEAQRAIEEIEKQLLRQEHGDALPEKKDDEAPE